MEVRVTLENLRAGEKPLAMFLHDALRHIDEQYFENIVASYARNARVSSQPSDSSSNSHRDKMLDERGRRRTSLEQFDLTFQLNLFETLLGKVGAGYSDEGIPQHIRTAFKSSLHLRNDTFSKLKTLRILRNDIVHHHLDRGDIAATIGELGKILDVFRGELLTCCKSQPDVFTLATVSSIQGYVDSIVSILKIAQSAEQAHGEEQRSADQPVVPAQPARQLPKFAFAVGGAAVLALAVVVLLRMMNAEPDPISMTQQGPVATKAAVFMMNAPLPEDKVAKFCKDLSRKMSDNQSMFRITIIRYNESDTTVFLTLDSGSVARKLAPIMRSVKPLPSVLEMDDLFNGFVTALLDSSSLTVNASIKMFGNIPMFTDSEIDSLDGKKEGSVHLLKDEEGVKSTFRKLRDRRLSLVLYKSASVFDSMLAERIKRGTDIVNLDLEQL